MGDDEIRLDILKSLKELYDENPHSYKNNAHLLNDLKILKKELDRNIRYLEQKGVIDVRWYLGGNFIAKINSYGIDVIENLEKDDEDEALTTEEKILGGRIESITYVYPKKVLGSLIHEIKEEVDKTLMRTNPEILERLELIYKDLGARNNKHTYAKVAFDCREIIKDFTDSIFKEEFLKEEESIPNRNQTKNKLRIVLRAKMESETESRLISERFDYIMNYFDVLSDYIQKKSHPDNFKVTYEDARNCLIHTYLFIRDMIISLKL